MHRWKEQSVEMLGIGTEGDAFRTPALIKVKNSLKLYSYLQTFKSICVHADLICGTLRPRQKENICFETRIIIIVLLTDVTSLQSCVRARSELDLEGSKAVTVRAVGALVNPPLSKRLTATKTFRNHKTLGVMI